MTQRAIFGGAFALVMMAMVASPRAHHSFAMFDMNKSVTYEGRVVEYPMDQPPHTHHHTSAKQRKGYDDSRYLGR